MKRVKIFLASSIEDLREDRLQVGDFIRQLNEIYLDSDVHFSLVKCEDYDNSLSAGGKQPEYDREIRESELVFFLFFRKVGDYTKHEFEVALEAFQQQKKPKIITYFRTVSASEEAEDVRAFMQLLDGELKHYYNTYGHIDTLKLGMLMQLKLLKLDASQLKLENGQVLLGGKAVLKTENVPILRGNQTLRELTENRRQLQAQLDQYRSAYLADPTPEKEAAFFHTSAELNRVSKDLTQVEQETMALLTSVAEMTSDGRVLTRRLKDALKQFDRGDYAAVRAILADEERENELRRAENRAATAKNEIQGYVEEELLLIKTEKTQGINRQRAQRIRMGYEKLADLVEKHDLDKMPVYDYACFLYEQNDHSAAIAVAEKLQWHWSKPGEMIPAYHQAILQDLLGTLYSDTNNEEKAKAAFCKSMELRVELVAQDPDMYETSLAHGYASLGNMYAHFESYTQAEQAYRKAETFFARQVERKQTDCEQELATLYNNLGNVYTLTGRYEEARAVYDKSMKIVMRWMQQDPNVGLKDLARICGNLSNLYAINAQYDEAEREYNRAIEIYTSLVKHNPAAFEPALAGCYHGLGTLYRNVERYPQAKEAACRAVEIYTRLAEWNPSVYERNLAICYDNLNILYAQTEQYAETEDVYRRAEENLTRIEEKYRALFQTELVPWNKNREALYSRTQHYAERVEMYHRTIEVYARLAERNPEEFDSELSIQYNCLTMLYMRTYHYNEAIEVCLKEIEVDTRLAEREPERYEPNLAGVYTNLGILYSYTKNYIEMEKAYCKAKEIYAQLAMRNADKFESFLAATMWDLAGLYERWGKRNELVQILRQAQPLYEKLAQKCPERYQEEAETIRNALSEAD